MTCIIGLEHDNHVYMGGDSFCGGNDWAVTLASPKVWKQGPYVIGTAGSLPLQHIARAFKWPKPPTDNVQHFLASKVAPAMRQRLSGSPTTGCR